MQLEHDGVTARSCDMKVVGVTRRDYCREFRVLETQTNAPGRTNFTL